MDKFKNKYRIPSNRLQHYDYGANGCYFVTICTRGRLHYFGEIIPRVETDNYPSAHNTKPFSQTETDNYPSLQCTAIGKVAEDYWLQIPQHFPFVVLDEFIIMPNHIHGILFFDKPEKSYWEANRFGRQSQNLGAVIRGFKAMLKRYANEHRIEFAWQERYYDRVIRDNNELENVRRYILNNPANWQNDELNKPNRNT